MDFPNVVVMLKEFCYDRYVIIEREIGGEEQTRDILAVMVGSEETV